jgi:hypothetical protein
LGPIGQVTVDPGDGGGELLAGEQVDLPRTDVQKMGE